MQRTGPSGQPRSWIAEDAAGNYAGMHSSRVAAGLELARRARDPQPAASGEPLALELEEELAPEEPALAGPVPEILEELITNAARILAGELEPSHRYALAQVEKHAWRMLEELELEELKR